MKTTKMNLSWHISILALALVLALFARPAQAAEPYEAAEPSKLADKALLLDVAEIGPRLVAVGEFGHIGALSSL